MNGLKAKLNWGKIKDFLFKNKKRKIIVACTFALAVVLLLCAILIPVLSNMNKKFEREEDMLTYMTGVYTYAGESKYIIFDVDNKCYRGDSFSYGAFCSYFTEYLSTTKDLDAVKNLTFEECINNMEILPYEDAEYQYSKGKIILEKNDTIDIKKDVKTISDSKKTYYMRKLADTPLACDEFKENFEKAKDSGINAKQFVPSFSELKELIKSDSKTSALVNTNYSMSAINNNEDMDMFFLGKCTNANSSEKEKACISTLSSDSINGAGLSLFSTDPTVSLNDLLTIIDLYLQDVPTYPGESAHADIKNEMQNGKLIQKNTGNIINSDFNLYGIYFQTTCQERTDGTVMYMISVHPKTISLS